MELPVLPFSFLFASLVFFSSLYVLIRGWKKINNYSKTSLICFVVVTFFYFPLEIIYVLDLYNIYFALGKLYIMFLSMGMETLFFCGLFIMVVDLWRSHDIR